MSLNELKQKLTTELKEMAVKMERNDKLQLAINLDMAPATIERYTGGEVEEVRRLDLAEVMLAEGNKILEAKKAIA